MFEITPADAKNSTCKHNGHSKRSKPDVSPSPPPCLPCSLCSQSSQKYQLSPKARILSYNKKERNPIKKMKIRYF